MLQGATGSGGEKVFNRTKSYFGKKLGRDLSGELGVGEVIGVVILVIIGLLMLPLVQSAVTDAQNASTVAAVDSLLGMVTIFYVLGIALAAVLWVVKQAKQL